MVGPDVLCYCKEMLNGNRRAREVNNTIFVLIPKLANSKDMTNYRPISLCHVIYKMVAKVWANRLKILLLGCICQNQSTFMPGRMIHDNFLIAHELVHYLQSAKNSPNKGFMAKLDMSMAYDRVEWCFLEKILLRMRFIEDWVGKIMDCIYEVKYTVKCN